MSAFGQAGFGSKNRQNQLRSQGQMDPFGQQVRQAMQPPTLNIYQAPQATVQAQTGGTAQPAPAVNMTAQTGGTLPTKPVTPGTAQPIQPQSQGTQYASDPTYASRVASAAQEWNSTPAGSQQRDWVGNTVSKMPPELAAQWQSMQSGQGGLGAGGDTMPPGTANPFGYYYNSRGERFHGEVFNPVSAYRMDDSGRLVPYLSGQNGGQPTAPDPALTGGVFRTAPGTAQTQALPFLSSAEMTQRVQGMPVPAAVAAAGAEAVANWRNSQLSELNAQQAQDQWNQYNESRVLDPSLPAMTQNDFYNPMEGSGAISGAYGTNGPFNVNLTNEQILPPWMRNRSASPGTAQPIQPQSQGTPYGEQGWSSSAPVTRTEANAGVPEQQLAWEEEYFRRMAQNAVNKEALHGVNHQDVQAFLSRMAYQGFDPRSGLQPEQWVNDAQNVRARNDAIRNNPLAYLRGEI